MKFSKAFIAIFGAACLIGVGSAILTGKFSGSSDRPVELSKAEIIELAADKLSASKPDVEIESIPPISYSAAKSFGGAQLLDEDSYEEEIDYKYELLNVGEFHGDEVSAATGERWLGLFEGHSGFTLRSEKIKVTRVFDEIADDEDKNEKTGKEVSVGGVKSPFFLIKNASKLKNGKVKTLHIDEIYKEDQASGYESSLKTGIDYSFRIGEKDYILRVAQVYNKKAELVYALILESGAIKQILHVSDEDNLGGLYWAGDLDGDQKPDFYLAPWIKENITEKSLFLSSEAEKNNLVKKVAAMTTVGC